MNIDFLQEKFLALCETYYGNKNIIFYAPTNENNFQKVETEQLNDNEFDVISENEYAHLVDFQEIIKDYPKITFDKDYASRNKFVSWEDLETAFKGEKEIDLI